MSIKDLILYLVIGSIFLLGFNFTTSAQPVPQFGQKVVNCFVIGYILVNAFYTIPISFGVYFDIVFMCAFTLLLSYFVGQFYFSDTFRWVLRKIRINRTVNQNIWNDIEDKNGSLWVHVGFKELDIQYMGILQKYEDYQRCPLIVLAGYSMCAWDELIDYSKIDHSKELEHCALIDTSKADFIRFIYDKNSYNVTRQLFKSGATKSVP